MMEKHLGDTKIGLFTTGENQFPHIEGIKYQALAICDGPIAIVTKENPSVLHIYHRIGTRLGKKSFGNREFILGIYWMQQNTLAVITSKGIVYFLSLNCSESTPSVRVSNLDIFRAFVTESCVVVQQDRSELLVYPIDALLKGHVVWSRLPIESPVERVFSSANNSSITVYIQSAFTLESVFYPSGITFHSECKQKIVTFESRIENIEPDFALEKVTLFIDRCFHVYTQNLDLRLARIHLPANSLLLMETYFITPDILTAVFRHMNGIMYIFLVNLTDQSVNSFKVPMARGDRYIGSIQEADGVRLHTTGSSYLCKLIDAQVARFEDETMTCASNQLKEAWHRSTEHADDEIDCLMPLFEIDHEERKPLLDCAIAECLELSMAACETSSRKQALCTALYGMKFSREDWTEYLLKARSFHITFSVLQKCAFPAFLTKEQQDTIPMKYLIERCVEYGEYERACTLAGLHNEPLGDITMKWVKYVVKEKALSDQEVLDEISAKLGDISQPDLLQLLFIMKENDRQFALEQTLKSFSKNPNYRLLLLRVHIFSKNYSAALRLAETLGDIDSITYILLQMSPSDKAIINEALPESQKFLQNMQKMLTKSEDPSESSKRKHIIRQMAQKWDRCLVKMRRLPPNEWTSLTSDLGIELELLGGKISMSSRRSKKYVLWISNTIQLLSQQCRMAKQTGNLGFLGKTFHETVIMCHSYSLNHTIDELSRHFSYGEETKFWLYLLYLCEIKDWQGADIYIAQKMASRRLNIGPGATEVLWECGRYASSIPPTTAKRF